MENIIKLIEDCFNKGGKLLIFGNGGSAAESSHFAAEFINIRKPAIALNDPAILTAISNDYSYEEVFSRQIIALANAEDLIIGISSSGKSRNVNYAYEICKLMHLNYVDFPREGSTTAEVQENQLRLIHKIYDYFKQNPI